MKTVPSEWVTLSMALHTAGCYKPSRISSESLCDICKQGRAYVMKEEIGGVSQIIAFGALWSTESPKWLEVGTVFVAPSHKGKQLSARILNGLLSLLPDNTSLFMVTRSESLASIATANGWTKAKSWKTSPCVKAFDPKRPLDDGREIYYRLSTAS